MHRWEITLARLDEGEVGRLAEFFAENEGMLGNFAFTDPWDGRVYSNCSLDTDALEFEAVAEMCGATSLVIRENRA